MTMLDLIVKIDVAKDSLKIAREAFLSNRNPVTLYDYEKAVDELVAVIEERT